MCFTLRTNTTANLSDAAMTKLKKGGETSDEFVNLNVANKKSFKEDLAGAAKSGKPEIFINLTEHGKPLTYKLDVVKNKNVVDDILKNIDNPDFKLSNIKFDKALYTGEIGSNSNKKFQRVTDSGKVGALMSNEISAIPVNGVKESYTYVDPSQIQGRKVVDLSAANLQNFDTKGEFEKLMGKTTASGSYDKDIVIKVNVRGAVNNSSNVNTSKEVYISLKELNDGTRAKLLDTLGKSIQTFKEVKNAELTGLSLILPYLETNKESKYSENSKYFAGGISVDSKAKIATTTVKTEIKGPVTVTAEDLSNLTSLNDKRSLEYIRTQVEPKIREKLNMPEGAKLAVGGGEVTDKEGNKKAVPAGAINPTYGFNIGTTQGNKELRAMFDVYLDGGKFDGKEFNRVPGPADIKKDGEFKYNNKPVTEYKQQVLEGFSKLIGDGYQKLQEMNGKIIPGTGKKDVNGNIEPGTEDTFKFPESIKPGMSKEEFVETFAEKIFNDRSFSAEDIKFIQTAFAAMAHNETDNGFQRLQEMENPDTGQKPKNMGIDGVPATRFVVVTSTLMSAMQNDLQSRERSTGVVYTQGEMAPNFNMFESIYNKNNNDDKALDKLIPIFDKK
jgi:hypothetical protein